jgi:hypothetical protein
MTPGCTAQPQTALAVTDSWREGSAQQVTDAEGLGAAARIALLGVPVAVHGQQSRSGQLVGKGDRGLVGGIGVTGVAEEQDRVLGNPVPRAGVAVLTCGSGPVRAFLGLPCVLATEAAVALLRCAGDRRIGGEIGRLRRVGADDCLLPFRMAVVADRAARVRRLRRRAGGEPQLLEQARSLLALPAGHGAERHRGDRGGVGIGVRGCAHSDRMLLEAGQQGSELGSCRGW